MQTTRITPHSRRVSRGPVKITRGERCLTYDRKQPLECPDDVSGSIGDRQSRLANPDGFFGISLCQMIGRQTEMSRNYRGNVESRLAATLGRSFFLTTRKFPCQIEILLRFLVSAAPEIDQAGPHVKPREKSSLIETFRETNRALCRLERGVPVSDAREILNGHFSRP